MPQADSLNDPSEHSTVSYEESLAANAVRGDERALQKLAEMYRPQIYRFIAIRLRSPEDAEDTTQETFLRVGRSIADLKDPARFRSMLYTVAVNLMRDRFRRRKFTDMFRSMTGIARGEDADMEFQAAESDPEAVLQSKQAFNAVREFIHALPQAEQEVFSLRFMQELTIREIAEALSKSESSVKTHLYRAAAKFKNNGELRKIVRS